MANASQALEWTLVSSEEEFHSAMNLTDAHQLIVVDLETTKSTQYGGNKMIGVCWGFPVGGKFRAFYAPFRHGWPEKFPKPENLPEHLIPEFKRWLDKDHIYHNAAADLIWLYNEGVDFTGDRPFVWDTIVTSHLVNEHEFAYGLDDLSLKYYKERKASLKDLEKEIRWDEIPPYLMGRYACTDVFLTFKHYLRTRATLEHEGMISVYSESEKYLKTLLRIVDRGIAIDLDLCRELQESGRRELVAFEDELKLNPAKASQVIKRLHGPRSEGGYGVPILYRTKGGQPATDSTSLIRYTDQYPDASDLKDFCEKVVAYRTLSKQVSTWYQGFFDKADAHGRLHPGIRQYGTVTSRLSQREPNLQQIPRNAKNVRKLFMDYDDWVLVEFDYSQVELRLASWYLAQVGDNAFFESYRNGLDVHTGTSERLGLHRTMGAKEGRQIAKQINFLLLYGGGYKKFRDTLYKESGGEADFSLNQCFEWHKGYHQIYPGVAKLGKQAQRRWEDVGYVKYWNGRRRHMGPRDKGSEAWNAIIQGGCGQILMYSLNLLDRRYPDLRIVNTVHDSIWVYLRRDEVDDRAPGISAGLSEIPSERFELPFEVEWKYWRDTT